MPKENVLYLNTPPPEGMTSRFAKLELRQEFGLGKPRTTFNMKFSNSITKNPQISCTKSKVGLNDILSHGALGIAKKQF